jgi:hypothetical protein
MLAHSLSATIVKSDNKSGFAKTFSTTDGN